MSLSFGYMFKFGAVLVFFSYLRMSRITLKTVVFLRSKPRDANSDVAIPPVTLLADVNNRSGEWNRISVL